MSRSLPHTGRAPSTLVAFYGLAAILVFAAIFLGTWRPLPLMLLQVGSVAVAAAVLLGTQWAGLGRRPGGGPGPPQALPLSRPVRIYLTILLLAPLAQLIPLPLALWAELPGRWFYLDAIPQAAYDNAQHGWRAVSLIPAATEAAWLALLPPLAVFLVTIRLDRERLTALLWLFLAIAVGEALLGLGQYGHSLKSDSALGTYRNRNHLAGLLEMALPVALALLAAAVGQRTPPRVSGRHRRRGRTLRQWFARFSVDRIDKVAALGAATLAILLGLIFTRSRAGVALGMLAIMLATLAFSYRLGGRNAYGLTGTLTAIGLSLASLIGLAPVWSRFAFADPLEDGRWKIYDATVRAIGEFFPLGSGPGTFLQVIHRFHPTSFPGVTINRAHNDYLEWSLELGFIAAVLIGAWLLFYFRQWVRVWRRGEWTPFRFAQAGCGISLFLMMLHSAVDYNLRTPANAVFAAFLAAVFFQRSPARARGESNASAPPSEPGRSRAWTLGAIPPENRVNPLAPLPADVEGGDPASNSGRA